MPSTHYGTKIQPNKNDARLIGACVGLTLKSGSDGDGKQVIFVW